MNATTITTATQLADPLRRLTPTPHAAHLSVMGRTIGVETNSAVVLEALTSLFPALGAVSISRPDFRWRIIGEAEGGSEGGWPEMTAFSDERVRYANLGKRGFFAVDLNEHEAVAFLPEEFARDSTGFSSVFTATLYDLTASALGLVQLSAACVSLDGCAVLVIGPPRSGKTTSTHYASTLDLKFHSDQASYLDLRSGALQVWGQFWPAAFREESAEYLPELRSAPGGFRYAGISYRCLAGDTRGQFAHPVTPAACVFLEREGADVPQLIALPCSEHESLLSAWLSFREDERFEAQRRDAIRELAKLPAYRLPYGKGPEVAATFLYSLLRVHKSLAVES